MAKTRIRIDGDSKPAEQAIARTKQGVQSLGKEAKKATEQVRRATMQRRSGGVAARGGGMLGQIGGLGGLSIIGAVTAAVKVFETSMQRAATAAVEFAKLKHTVRDIRREATERSYRAGVAELPSMMRLRGIAGDRGVRAARGLMAGGMTDAPEAVTTLARRQRLTDRHLAAIALAVRTGQVGGQEAAGLASRMSIGSDPVRAAAAILRQAGVRGVRGDDIAGMVGQTERYRPLQRQQAGLRMASQDVLASRPHAIQGLLARDIREVAKPYEESLRNLTRAQNDLLQVLRERAKYETPWQRITSDLFSAEGSYRYQSAEHARRMSRALD